MHFSFIDMNLECSLDKVFVYSFEIDHYHYFLIYIEKQTLKLQVFKLHLSFFHKMQLTKFMTSSIINSLGGLAIDTINISNIYKPIWVSTLIFATFDIQANIYYCFFLFLVKEFNTTEIKRLSTMLIVYLTMNIWLLEIKDVWNC